MISRLRRSMLRLLGVLPPLGGGDQWSPGRSAVVAFDTPLLMVFLENTSCVFGGGLFHRPEPHIRDSMALLRGSRAAARANIRGLAPYAVVEAMSDGVLRDCDISAGPSLTWSEE